jgi:hypothetical protein
MSTVWLPRALSQTEQVLMRSIGAPHQLRWWQTPKGTYFHAFQVHLIYGSIVDGRFLCNDQSACESRDTWALRNVTITHALDAALTPLLIPPQFLQEYYVRSGGAHLRAPKDMRAHDLILCEFPTAPVSPTMA